MFDTTGDNLQVFEAEQPISPESETITVSYNDF